MTKCFVSTMVINLILAQFEGGGTPGATMLTQIGKLTVKHLGLGLVAPYFANRISSKDSKTGETGYEKDKVTTVARDIFNDSPVHIIHDLSIKFNTLSKAPAQTAVVITFQLGNASHST